MHSSRHSTETHAAIYRIYGMTLASHFPFRGSLAKGEAPPDLTFTCSSKERPPAERIPDRLEAKEPSENQLLLNRGADRDLLTIVGRAEFAVGADEITARIFDPQVERFMEIWLLGTVLAYWLERQGIPVLHAAAIVAGGGAVGFMASNKGGKSSLAATMLKAGYSLLSDDCLALRWQGQTLFASPGQPQMRFWPDQADHFLGRHEDLELVVPDESKRRVPVGPSGFGSFFDRPTPLRCLYLPSRQGPSQGGTDIEIRSVGGMDAVIELVRNSFIPYIVEFAGWQAQRLQFFAELVRRIPVRRLTYPDGVEHLPRVRDAILEDLETLPA